MSQGFHTRTTLRDFGRRDRNLFLRQPWYVEVLRWIRKWMGGGK